ncbi:DEAD/DEAH box helicase family protein [Sorangium sp. So ce185]|uniref:DEAD/DEAH box helicase family protein n=1 Tax=Sorangium sp. So ce185 TaxID=3133287 RepID=UPI003F646097
MKSQNFEFLRRKHPELADLGGFAEAYARPDPGSALLKLRLFVEHVVGLIYTGYQLPRPYSDNLNDMLNETVFRSAVPEVVLNKLHAIRKSGNRAAHREAPTTQVALLNLRDGFDIAQWVHVQLDGGSQAQCPQYREPPPPAQPGATLEKEKEAHAKLAAQEAQLQKVLADLETERKKREAAEQSFTVTKEQLDQLRAEGQKAANILHFNERATRRRLIDEELIEAGWDVGQNGKSTEQVRQEVQLSAMPTPSGDGFADYVLYGDDGKPLAVIEAKRTSKDARVGAEQARIYATCLEKETGQRPAAFYTNGNDIYLWDDAQGYTPRKVYGFYSKDSLEYLIHQRKNKTPLTAVAPNLAIAERMYQLEAVKRVSERFEKKSRRALLVQATGTGKTRVAISLCDVLMRAGWAKRILFLCDRRELRKQADSVFKEFMPGEPRVVVDSTTSSDRDKRIYLATYPAMMKCFESFDVGFFDLVIADESHRSIYKKYRELFLYFDALQVGLTATPVQYIDRDTFKLFGCENNDPTSNFGFEEAVNSTPPYLVPFRVREYKSKFRKEGFKYSQMSPEQRAQLEEQEDNVSAVEHEPGELDKDVFNKDTSRIILRSLMEEGIRDATGSRVGKTILFARNHVHAVHLAELFNELYPQYGGTFCRVIDNQEARADQLIDDFKNKDSDPVIAISVDMLDTGIDVPEVVNLVFAKPVKSYVKFWQMIGRGTRLCRDLFGPRKHKTEFLIFDHGRNFWFFEEKYKEKQPSPQKSLLQKIFEARIAVAEAALDKMNEPVFQATVDLLVQDIRDVIASKSIEVRDRRKELELLSHRDTLAQFAAATKADLLSIAAPLMQWRNIRGDEDAYRFDLLVTRLEEAVLRGAPAVADLKAAVEGEVARLMKNQNPVKAKAAAIQAVESREFWSSVTVPKLEEIRSELRGIMKYQAQVTTGRLMPRVFDVTDADVEGVDHTPKLEGLELIEYRHRVEKVIREHFGNDPTLQRIRAGKPVPEAELEALTTLVLRVDDKANLKHLVQPELKQSLLDVLRGLVGLDPAAVDEAFTGFVHKHPRLSAQQLRFMQVLKNHIAQNGGIELERLYEPPFTTIHAEGIDGVFTEVGQVDEILAILETFQPRKASASNPPPSARQAS